MTDSENAPHSKTLSTIYRDRKVTFDHILTADVALKRALLTASRVARTDTPVLLRGEPGTGKSLLAQAIHNASQRRNQSFVVIGPGDTTGEDVRSRLFGEGGSPGMVQLAHGGSLVLDDLQDWPPASQALAEQLVDFREILPAGTKTPVHVNVRLIATVADAPAVSGEPPDSLSPVLYQRLRGCEILLPPLSARRQDVELLAKEFLQRFIAIMQCPAKSISGEALAGLKERRWYGNVRELEQAVRAAAITALEEKTISLAHIPAALRNAPTSDTLPFRLDEMEKLAYQRALDAANGNRKKAIHLLGVAPSTFYRKARAFGLVAKDEGTDGGEAAD